MNQFYKHPKTKERISRQRAYQIKLVASGMCQHHANEPIAEGSKTRCQKCLDKWRSANQTRKRIDAAIWQTMDWTKPLRQIATELGVCYHTAYLKRLEFTDYPTRSYKRRPIATEPTAHERAILEACPMLTVREFRESLGMGKGRFWGRVKKLEFMGLLQIRKGVKVKGYREASAIGLTDLGKQMLAKNALA